MIAPSGADVFGSMHELLSDALGVLPTPTTPLLLSQAAVLATPYNWNMKGRVNGAELSSVVGNKTMAPGCVQASMNAVVAVATEYVGSHTPATQGWPVGQTLPQVPQLFTSVRVSMHIIVGPQCIPAPPAHVQTPPTH